MMKMLNGVFSLIILSLFMIALIYVYNKFDMDKALSASETKIEKKLEKWEIIE